MLKVIYRLRDMDIEKLMVVYEEGNLENGRELYPDEEPSVQLLRAEQDFCDYLRTDFFCVQGAFYALWEEMGTYVSALRMEPYRDGLLLEALETTPSRRGEGYAKRLLDATMAQLPKKTVVYSHVGKRNLPSLRVHMHSGFQQISEQAVYVDGSVNDRCCTMKAEVH